MLAAREQDDPDQLGADQHDGTRRHAQPVDTASRQEREPDDAAAGATAARSIDN
jgi:hypothetical protein